MSIWIWKYIRKQHLYLIIDFNRNTRIIWSVVCSARIKDRLIQAKLFIWYHFKFFYQMQFFEFYQGGML